MKRSGQGAIGASTQTVYHSSLKPIKSNCNKCEYCTKKDDLRFCTVRTSFLINRKIKKCRFYEPKKNSTPVKEYTRGKKKKRTVYGVKRVENPGEISFSKTPGKIFMNRKDYLQYMETHKDMQGQQFGSIAEAQNWVFRRKRR